MELIDLIYKKHKIISIVGMAKNAGKTVTFNHLLYEAFNKNIILGVTSTGRDGEIQDLATNTKKPPIYLMEGMYVATAADTLDRGDARVEVMYVTDYRTPLGAIVIGRVVENGYLEIAGPQTANTVREVSNTMLELGAELILVDGAINRVSSASPYISEGTILATGAVVSRDMNKVIEDTIHTTNLFKLPEINVELRTIVEEIMKKGKIALVDKDYNITYIDVRTALNSGNIIGTKINSETRYVVIPGSLSKKTVGDIIESSKYYKNVKFIVKDGTKIFIDSKTWLEFIRKGFKVEVLNSIEVLALTLNPYSPKGYYFDPKEFLFKTMKYIKEIPVFDVVFGGE